ncbi:MAG: transporter [Cyclobacteriaceae bacterium]|nr:MAG: transporter [Cyclobacteriaceae bacterium]
MRIKLVLTWCLFPVTGLFAQFRYDTLFATPDTATALTLEGFYQLVIKNHPLARQAALLSEVARQEIRLARGNFDPKAEITYLTKNFNNTEYYDKLNAQIKFPSLFPLDPAVGLERNSGTYLSSESYIPPEYNYRQLYAALALPLGQGLLTDTRRAALRQAELFKDLTEAEQVSMINKVLLDAAKEYWNWFYSYYLFRLQDRGVAVATEIFERTRLNAQMGEASAIDTVQALITLQSRIIERQEALLGFLNAGVTISTFLWDSLGNPVDLPTNWIPVPEPEMFALSASELEALRAQARINHPDLRKLSVKLLQLDVERRLNAEFLKPRLDLKYYLLNQPFDPEGNAHFSPANDYKFGLDFSFPLFLRKERAKLAQTKLKITATEYDRMLTERQIVNNLQATYNTLVTTASVLNNQLDMVNNYERLLQAELLNLRMGESDLFKINLQLEYLLRTQGKWLKLLSDYSKQKALLYWAAGIRNLGEELP